MIVKGIIDEDFVNYKVPSMVIEMPKCSFKCGMMECQNSDLALAPDYNINYTELVERYMNNPITEAVVFQGLEPFDSFQEMLDFVSWLRECGCDDDVVIYTGYDKNEIEQKLTKLKNFGIINIIIKYGRYIPNQQSHYDELLGVNLISDNQYAERIC